MARADAYGNVVGMGGSSIEWDSAELLDYFERCQAKYDRFLGMSDTLIRNFQVLVDDPDHTGPEADASKDFLSQVQIVLVEDIIYAIQTFMGMQTALLQEFSGNVDSAVNAILKAEKLTNVINDFMSYYAAFTAHTVRITDIANALNSECSEAGSFTVPNPENAKNTWKEFVSEDGGSGFVPELKRAFEEFDALHSADIQGSAFDAAISAIEKNLSVLMAKSGDCLNTDITTFSDTGNSLGLVDIDDILTDSDRAAYDTYLGNMKDYLLGKKERCEVYKYDPVNMCSGNYINEQDDLTIGGAYPITFHRFYNAIHAAGTGKGVMESDIGRGWCHSFSMHVEKDGEDRIKVSCPDGSTGSYIKRDGVVLHLEGMPFEPQVWTEEHGEPGELTEYEDGYRLVTDGGIYTEFDRDGCVISLGDGNGEKISVRYEGTGAGRRLLMVKAPNGCFIRFRYEEATGSRITGIIDHTDRTVSYSYDGNGCLTCVTMPDGAQRRYGYTQDGLIGSVMRADGTVSIRNTYDESGRTLRQDFPDGGQMTYAYDDKDRTCTATEQNGNVVIYVHDSLGRHTCTKYADGTMEKFRYNKRSEKISHTDRNGNTTRYSYDGKGHLTGVVDALGNRTSITYNADGKVSVLKDAEGASWHYHYDKAGNLCESENPLGERTKLLYENGLLCEVRDAEGGRSRILYDAAGNAVQTRDAAGVAVSYTYDALGRTTQVQSAEGAVTSYTYDEMDRIVSVTDPLGGQTRYDYNASGKVAAVTNPDGTTRTVSYNGIGKPCLYRDEAGNETRIGYNSMWEEEDITLPNGGHVRYTYDAYMRVTGVTDPQGRQTLYRYDAQGNLTSIQTGDSVSASYTYDACGRQTGMADGEGKKTEVSYDGNGRPVMAVDAAGGKTYREYDALGRVCRITDALGNRTLYSYTKRGEISAVTDAAGRTTQYLYGNGGRLEEVHVCGDVTERYAYDACGRVSRCDMADGLSISYRYDLMDRVIGITGSNGRQIRYEYDVMGRAVRMDDSGRVTSYSYTASGKLCRVRDSLGNITEYEYDSLGALTKVIRHDSIESENSSTDGMASDGFGAAGVDTRGHVTIYEHNPAGELTGITDALGQKESYEYDASGRLLSKTDRDGYVTGYTYNAAGLAAQVSYSDGRQAGFQYDALNRLSEIQDWLGRTELENDALGRLIRVKDYEGRTVSYEYGAGNERRSITYPDGHTVRYEYDEDLRLKAVTGNGDKTTYTYDELGRLSAKENANGTQAAYRYYPGGLLKSLTSSDRQGILDRYVYHYDDRADLTQIDRSRRDLEAVSGTYSYHYDALGRLEQTELDGKIMAQYRYDAFGNRKELAEGETRTGYTYDALDRLMETIRIEPDKPSVRTTYTYDRRGNQTGIAVNGQIRKQFLFDATNMMTEAHDAAKGKAAYTYNGLGFRTGLQDPDGQTSYLCDLSREYYNLLERTVNGETERFVYDNNVISMQKAGKNYFYLQDELGSAMYLTGTDGETADIYAYDDFGQGIDPYTGKRKSDDGRKNYTKQGNILQPFAFTGYQEDSVSGLSFAQARYYNAENGRFTGEDQVRGFVGKPDTQNHYLYCLNNSRQFIDPNGKWAEWVENTVKIISAVAAVTLVASAIVVTAPAAITVGLGIVAGAVVTGVISGYANEQNGGSYTNGFIGGSVAGAVQTSLGYLAGPAGLMVGGAANGLGSKITDELDNSDNTNSKYKSEAEIKMDALKASGKGIVFSIPGAYMQYATGRAFSAVSSFGQPFVNGLNQFYGTIDNFLMAGYKEKLKESCGE